MFSVLFSGARRAALVAAVVVVIAGVARVASQGNAPAYTVYTAEGRRTLPFRTNNGVDFVSLDQLAQIFGIQVAEDTLVGGLTLHSKGQTILLIPGQSFASIGPGRVVSLPAAVQRDRNVWQVPVEFIRQVLGPALGLKVEARRPTHVILTGDVRLPQITARLERNGPGARLSLDVQPSTPHRITREGNRLIIRFDAVALEFAAVAPIAEFATAVRADGTTLLVDLGPSVAGYRADDSDATHLVIDLFPAGVPPPPPPIVPRPVATPDPPVLGLPLPTGAIRTVVIDPGHGGDEAGARGPSGTQEKDFVLQMARRLKSSIEARIGVHVLLTRDNDEAVPQDRRTAMANNNKADLLISLHANASSQPQTRGAQVLSLSLADYSSRRGVEITRDLPVPVTGGGSRSIDVVPWDFAQIPFAGQSGVVASILGRQLRDHGVPLYTQPTARLPLRPLVGANMPAVMLEMGFLSNTDDEQALNGAELSGNIIDALLSTIDEIRRGIPDAPPERAAGPS